MTCYSATVNTALGNQLVHVSDVYYITKGRGRASGISRNVIEL